MIRIIFVIPYLDLKYAFDRTIATHNQKNIQVSMTHIFGSDTAIIDTLDADIIVARGITASAIANHHTGTHVIPIAMSSADLLDALAKAKTLQREGRIGIVSSEHLSSAETISSLIEREVLIYQGLDQQVVSTGVELLREQGCRVFVGGLTMSRICEQKGYPFVHVKSGEQAVEHAVNEAFAAANSLLRQKTRTNLLSTLLNNAAYAILAVDRDGKIINGNRQAALLFHCEHLEGEVASSLSEAEAWYGNDLNEHLVLIDERSYFVSKQALDVEDEVSGCLYTFQDADRISQSEHKIRAELQGKGLVARYTFADIVTQNVKMEALVERAKRFAQVAGSVLLLGETGTGKELFAQSIHSASSRANGPFVAVNCAALPEHLLESELFGYTDGAFTGATKGGKAGLFELAHKGTLFLDEIAEMPITVQAKLLRVLQEREVRKIGADMVIPVDVRIITAANSTLIERVREGEFRLDLFYRISLLTLTLVPLRERKDDLGILFRHFVTRYCNRHQIAKPTITDAAIALLDEFPWPGNIRELRNAAERLAILHTKETVETRDVEALDIGVTSLHMTEQGIFAPVSRPTQLRGSAMSDEELYEKFLVSGLTREAFAAQVGISRTTLWRRISQFE